MTISRENFKEWQQALLNGRLSAEQEELLMQFLEENIDLIDLDNEETMPRLVADQPVFSNKEALMRNPQNFDGLADFDLLAIKQLEEGLTTEEHQQLSQIIDNKPELNRDLNLYHQTKLQVSENIVFTNKQQLKHHKLALPTFSAVLRYSAAAAVVAGAMWFLWPTERQLTSPTNIALSTIETSKDSVVLSGKAPQTIDSIEVEQHQNLPSPSKQESNEPGITDPFLEPAEQLMASLQPKSAIGAIDYEELNAYEIGLNVMMPQYLDNQIEMGRYFAYTEPQSPSRRDNFVVRMLEGSVKVFNLVGNNDMKLDKYYDEDGNIVAYKLKGESIQWNQKVK